MQSFRPGFGYTEVMKRISKTILNVFIAVIVLWSWLTMVFRGGGSFSARGIWSLKYFTVLSNLLAAAAAVCWLFFRKRHFSAVLKFSACLAVMITFLVTATFLGPIFGYAFLYAGPNFWFHLAVPLLCLFDELFLGEQKILKKELPYSVLPLFIYGCFYLGNIILNGREGNDWYAFTTWGLPVGFAIFLFLLLLNYGMGMLISRLSKR